MKKVLLVATTVATLALLQGCSEKTAGLDSAYLNKNRGAAGAQISSTEAVQYARQQRLTAEEIRLENMKRHQKTDSIKEAGEAASSASWGIMNGVGAINSLKSLF
ncbi:MAG: hypothetical protein DSZ05_07210 [Sulfurospirillum sp.]|nr:MAG: hypothetical protein DSZ05_07210 [Sulfurospirillum sp.]